MKTPKHTPGPWTVYNNKTQTGGCLVSHLVPGRNLVYHLAETANEADARLIAAAPDCVAALQQIYDRLSAWYDDANDKYHTCEPRLEAKYKNLVNNYGVLKDIAYNAIVKATGGAE